MLPSWYLHAKMVHFGGFRQDALRGGSILLASRAKVSYLVAYQLGCLAAILASA